MAIHSSDSRAAARAEAASYAAVYASHADADLVAAPAKLASLPPAPTPVNIPQPTLKTNAPAVKESLPEQPHPDAGFLRDFLANHKEIEAYRSGAPLPLIGSALTIPAVIATARFPSSTASAVASALTSVLDDADVAAHLARSRALVDAKLAQNKSIYGVSTGFGGSAETRTGEHDQLGLALLQHQHAGILPTRLAKEADKNYARLQASSVETSKDSNSESNVEAESPLPLSPSPIPSSMPAAWVRGALLIRLNSLLRGHSAASRELLEGMGALLAKGVTPVVPLRGSISASGDLSPLSYIAGTLIGERGIYVTAPKAKGAVKYDYAYEAAVGKTKVQVKLSEASEDEEDGETQILRASDALKAFGLKPVSLRPKEHLAILNGTAFSCALAALCVEESRTLVMLGTACTALGTEALRGSIDSFCAFIQRVRPHPGQIETGALLTHLLEGSRLATSHLPARARYGSGLVGLKNYTIPGSSASSTPSSGANSNGPATPADAPAAHTGFAAKDVEGAIRAAAGVVGVDKIEFINNASDAEDDDDAEETIDKDAGTLRQDRYPLRTAPQWLGPQLEVVQKAAETIKIECNSTTDNPLIDPSARAVHHGGNFQALAVTSALEPLRLALFHVGKLLFSQATELQNPHMSGGGLAGNLAATDPSLNFFGKGVDIGMAAYVSELAYLATPVSTGVQSAEMHNQAVNSLALISARYTLQAIETLQLVVASYVYILCQALDLRALQRRARVKVSAITARALAEHLGGVVPAFKIPATTTAAKDDEALLDALTPTAAKVVDAVWATFDTAASLDGKPRAEKAAKSAVQGVVEILLASSSSGNAADALPRLPALQTALSGALYEDYRALVSSFLEGSYTPTSSTPSSTSSSNTSTSTYLPASPLLGRTRAIYEFVRRPRSQGGLGIGMHGRENFAGFKGGLGANARSVDGDGDAKEGGRTIGLEIGAIHEAIRDGRMRGGVGGDV